MTEDERHEVRDTARPLSPGHDAFMRAYHAECDRLGIKRPHCGDLWAWAYRSCHKDLWPTKQGE